MTWLDDPVAAALTLPPLALTLFVFFSALLEYIFPPYWGDTFVLLGFFLAGQGAAAPMTIFVAALCGSVAGSIAAYQLGRRYGLTVLRRISPRRQQLHSRRRIGRLFERFGERLLLFNRFLPVIRGVLLYGAGAMELRFRPVVFYCTVSNLAFIGLLMWAGLWTAGSWPQIEAVFQRSYRLIGVVSLVAVVVWLAVLLWRRRSRPSAGQ